MREHHILLVRYKPRIVSESRRTVHVIAIEGRVIPAVPKACCGEELSWGDLELHENVVGMPCELCMVRAPMSAPAALEA